MVLELEDELIGEYASFSGLFILLNSRFCNIFTPYLIMALILSSLIFLPNSAVSPSSSFLVNSGI